VIIHPLIRQFKKNKVMNILILSTGKPSKHLIDAITKRGHTYECYAPDELYLLVSDSIAGYDRLYAENGEATPKRLHLKNIDAVITRLGGGGEYGQSVLLQIRYGQVKK
jgi:hypothetical protein